MDTQDSGSTRRIESCPPVLSISSPAQIDAPCAVALKITPSLGGWIESYAEHRDHYSPAVSAV